MLHPTLFLSVLTTVIVLAGSIESPLAAQAPKGTPPADATPPALTYRGLIPGVSTAAEVRKTLGAPSHEARWYSWKMLYPSTTGPDKFDAVHLQSGDREKGVLGCVEAHSIPKGYATGAAIRERLGEPEFLLELSKQSLIDYSEKGVRFVVDASDRTVGVTYVPHGETRVHSGAERHVTLKNRPQGKQPRAAKDPTIRDLWCGAATADITPQEAAWFPKPFRVHDPLQARAVVFSRGELSVALVGADIFGMLNTDIQPVVKRLQKRGIDHVVVAMSHTHTAGDPIGIYGHYSKEYVQHIRNGIFEAVTEAWAKRRPVAKLLGGSDEWLLAGGRVDGLIRNARNPGLLNPQISVLQARDKDDQPIATIVQFACHPEGLETPDGEPGIVSADFPGVLCDRLADATGAPATYLNGALGGMISGDTRARTFEETKVAGERFAAEAIRVLSDAVPMAGELTCVRRRLEVPVTNPKMILFEKMSHNKFHRGRAVSELFHIRIGRAQILTIPGELLPELAYPILAKMEGYPRMIVGLANDELGYIIPSYDFRASAYEEGMSIGPAAGPIIRQQAERLLEE